MRRLKIQLSFLRETDVLSESMNGSLLWITRRQTMRRELYAMALLISQATYIRGRGSGPICRLACLINFAVLVALEELLVPSAACDVSIIHNGFRHRCNINLCLFVPHRRRGFLETRLGRSGVHSSRFTYFSVASTVRVSIFDKNAMRRTNVLNRD